MEPTVKQKKRKPLTPEQRLKANESSRRYYAKTKESRKGIKRANAIRHRERNKEHVDALNNARNLVYRKKNKERVKIANSKSGKKYRASHPEKIREIGNNYYHQRTKKDLGYKLGLNIRQKTYREVTRSLKTTKNGKFNKLSGCSYGELKDHIMAQFSEGMTIDNYGTFWNLDHVIPVSYAQGCPTALRVLSHYTNLRPMLCKDNIIKSDNCDLQLVSPEYEYRNPFL